ncbi:MAG: 1-(5-phosphoribosyl)-5-[(5-phosphoribosylamino)methylideneamino]imidazole-4-carboxamide isomerase [Candidatus Omnitrophota bacterium]|nr:1-(5-phosphoribosyl)-5-[(5-phosphoribosylamino)methylideneamino]imidazole-4-carboxamide isomerase [Candidatus Omnitrophota bacterium]MBU1929203.1 1-(5-phosphoribosyl)-5-[(5-phosphoribosylamino)methylideneamino]imidazole-4-carboxamide isomerase [Candidatus Omnitrophota bacterium]MBU2035494.1 1-(5-phosphoribosyl)-5-[(5-phosphoribosylamino)methylideneamino]imidazole-4-carboxamide isomerase [Candidatus Omnitrophota bacterium]MBU2221252.1 1-(5-phosphoribosyl)-5-[(5-phosphoribosylamino)methylidenea
MLIIPAIDLKDSSVVRLSQGRAKDIIIYSREPERIAREWVEQGAKILHVVDLDGAFTGSLKNKPLLKKILQAVRIPVEFGGGIRDIKTIKELLHLGVYRVALGTRAVEDMAFLKEAYKKFKNRIIVSIDARGKSIKTRGWKGTFKGIDLVGFALALKGLGFQEIIYTDTSKDGMLKGPNTAGIKGLLLKTGIGVIASGGVSSLKDIGELKKLEKYGLTAAIVGKALYEGKFTLKQALKLK